MSDELVVERRGPAVWLRLDRPGRRNALTVTLVTALAEAVTAAGADRTYGQSC